MGGKKQADSRRAGAAAGDSARAQGDPDGKPARKADNPKADNPKPDKKPRPGASGDWGGALRSVYDNTLKEPVPGDFLDLLGRLN